MRELTKIYYVCEECEEEYEHREDALTCESYGKPKKEKWIDIGLKKGFFAFGENGINKTYNQSVFGPINGTMSGQVISSPNKKIHIELIKLNTHVFLSHNETSESLSFHNLYLPDFLNPYGGWDFLRNVDDEKELEMELIKWVFCCKHYELEIDPNKLVDYKIFDYKRAKVLHIISRILG